MSAPSITIVSELLQRVHVHALLVSVARAAGMVAALFVVIALLEARAGADKSRYMSRNFLHDLCYALFYQGGFFGALLGAATANVLGSRLDIFKLDLVAQLPAPINWVAFWVIADFLAYWVHRFEHAWGPLWAFHSLHHSQERMTFVTTWRNHPLEQVIANLIMFVPLLILGIPTHTWLPLVVLQYSFEAVQHSALQWRYGPLYGVMVSPAFHAFHHSAEARHHNRNFGKIFVLWDRLFGTAVPDLAPPRSFGVEGLDPAPSLAEQLVLPFRLIYRSARRRLRGGERDAPPAGLPEAATLDIVTTER